MFNIGRYFSTIAAGTYYILFVLHSLICFGPPDIIVGINFYTLSLPVKIRIALYLEA